MHCMLRRHMYVQLILHSTVKERAVHDSDRWTRTGERIELKGMVITISSDSELCPRSSRNEHSQLEERSFVVGSSDLCHDRCTTFSLVDSQTRKEPETGLGGSPVIAVHVDSRQRSDKRYVLDKAVLFNQSSYSSPG